MATVIKEGHVEDIVDDNDGLRIKVRIKSDTSGEVPWAFPLLPKSIQSVPKVGEGALIILSDSANDKSQRYYLGPIISQQQFNTYCDYSYGRGNATSLLKNGIMPTRVRLSENPDTIGAFPPKEDLALVGRDSQDICMHNGEGDVDSISIRCGIRKKSAEVPYDKSYVSPYDRMGKIIFNNSDPAYIQLKYSDVLGSNVKIYDGNIEAMITDEEDSKYTNSVVNVVADKINLVGVNDPEITTERTYISKNGDAQLIPDRKIDDLMNELHQVPKGDILVKLLKKMYNAIINHRHNHQTLPPSDDFDINALKNWVNSQNTLGQKVPNEGWNSILSKYVRIS